MDDLTILAMQTTLDSVKTMSDKAIWELNQGNFRNSLLLLMCIILDLSNVAYDLNKHLLYHKIKE